MEIKNLEPKIFWEIFDAITKVPRPSKKEGKIREWLVNFAKEHELACKVDETGNVLVSCPATPGREDRETLVMQAHMDMVCEKHSDVKHDFENDPLDTYIDGDWVTARGTTLGADDGAGMALSLAAMIDKTYEHGPLEFLCTYDEETGMTGANKLSEGFMTGKLLLNLDSDLENQIFIGCAGGMDTVALWHYTTCPAPQDLYYAKVKVGGLLGGHSGGDIHLGRANANKILARFLATQPDALVADIHGGNLRNAIAREAYAVVGIPAARRDEFVACVNKFAAMVENEVAGVEPSFCMTLETVETPAEVIDPSVIKNLVKGLIAAPHGVIGMSHSMPGLVETSTNLASVKIVEKGTIRVETSQRSSVESQKKMIAQMVKTVFELAGAEVSQGEGYPGWAPNPNSRMVKVTEAAYRKVYGSEPETTAIHAGLETGLFLTKYPWLDMVSVGPTMQAIHSPEERLSISSVAKFWPYVKEIITSI